MQGKWSWLVWYVLGAASSAVIFSVAGLSGLASRPPVVFSPRPTPTSTPVITTTPTPTGDVSQYRVTKVVDGDTYQVNIGGEKKTLRLIGVDTPETVDPRKPVQCYGREASAKSKELVGDRLVRLEADPTQGDTDKYGRLLRYVFLPDGTFVNRELVAQGFAHEYTYNVPYKYMDEFKAAQKDAMEKKLGLWAPDACK